MMKKSLILIVLFAAGIFAAKAQTDFRHVSYKEAIEAAKKENKMVFIDFYTEWCGPCKRMMKEVFPAKEVGDFLNPKFVCVKIDAEKGEGKELAKRYKVTAYPTFVGIDMNEKELFRKEGGGSVTSFISELGMLIDPNKTPERLKERYEQGERTADLVKTYASLKLSEARGKRNRDTEKEAEVFRMVEDYFKGLSDEERLSSENLFVYKEFVISPFDEAARYMVKNRERFAPGIKEEIASLVEKVYEAQVMNYLLAQTNYDARKYSQMKREIAELGLNKNHYYDASFRFIECHAKGDLNTYMSLCESEFNKLNERQQASLSTYFANVVKDGDETIKKRASKFLRGLLADMDATSILFVAYQLMELEGKGH